MHSLPAWSHVLAVGIGAAAGAIGRWLLSIWLNGANAIVPWGTLTANLVGAYFIGLFLGFVVPHPGTPEWLRLLVTTGFLGGLTTFSTFSAEVVAYFARGAYLLAFTYIGASLFGALLLTAAGWLTVSGFR